MFPKCEIISDPILLIYNDQCEFCAKTAIFFSKGWCNVGVRTIANTSKEVEEIGLSYECVQKDVHVVINTIAKDKIVLSKGAACFFMMSLRYPSAAFVYDLIPWICEKSYLILKKIKGYL